MKYLSLHTSKNKLLLAQCFRVYKAISCTSLFVIFIYPFEIGKIYIYIFNKGKYLIPETRCDLLKATERERVLGAEPGGQPQAQDPNRSNDPGHQVASQQMDLWTGEKLGDSKSLPRKAQGRLSLPASQES